MLLADVLITMTINNVQSFHGVFPVAMATMLYVLYTKWPKEARRGGGWGWGREAGGLTGN